MFVVQICHDEQLLSFLNSYFVNGYEKAYRLRLAGSQKKRETFFAKRGKWLWYSPALYAIMGHCAAYAGKIGGAQRENRRCAPGKSAKQSPSPRWGPS